MMQIRALISRVSSIAGCVRIHAEFDAWTELIATPISKLPIIPSAVCFPFVGLLTANQHNRKNRKSEDGYAYSHD